MPGKTIGEILEALTEEQRTAVEYFIGEIISAKEDHFIFLFYGGGLLRWTPDEMDRYEKMMSKRTGKTCIMLPRCICGVRRDGDVLLFSSAPQLNPPLSECRQIEEDLSKRTGKKCIVLDPHIYEALVV